MVRSKQMDQEVSMNSFSIAGEGGRMFTIRVSRAEHVTPQLVRTVIELDLETFAESTFSAFTATSFLAHSRVYLLYADQRIIGHCMCMRTWDNPDEVSILSMGLRPGWRGRGLGQRFVLAIVDLLSREGATSMVLMVGDANKRAIKVYGDVGFNEVGECQASQDAGGRLLVLRKDLLHEK